MSMQTWAEKEIDIACKREREASGVNSKVIIRDRYPEGFDTDLSVHKKKQMIFKGG